MLTLQPIASPEDQRAALASFDPLTTTWIVSDLKTKLDLNRALLEERQFLPGEAVLRASELWKTLIARVRPDLQIVSREFATALIAERLSARAEAWARAPGAPAAAYEYLGQLMPILAHPQGDEMAEAWLEKNDAARARWGRWYATARDLWINLREDGFVAPPWAAGVLANEPAISSAWNRPLVVDLGAEITQVEADLIAAMSVELDVLVLKPDPAWADEQRRTLQPYEIFEKRIGARRPPRASQTSAPGATTYRKFTTMIAETKEAVAQARAWVDDGAELSNIAIVAPDIELYWPALSAYLDEEGLPAQKDRVARLHSFPDIARWLATLRLRAGAHAATDLELCLYETEGAPIGFDRFKSLFSAVYGPEDFGRSPEIKTLFEANVDENDVVGRDEFLAWALKQARDDMEPARIEKVLRRVFSEAPEPTRLAIRRWVDYVSQAAARGETTVARGDARGVAVIGLMSAENSPCEKMTVMGLTEAALRADAQTNILYADAQSLSSQFGFCLPHSDRGKLEFEARWALENSRREQFLMYPETDFTGAIQAPAWLWAKGAGAISSQAPRATRWDEIQRASLAQVAADRGWPSGRAELARDSILEDLAIKPLPDFGASLGLGLSASSIEDFLDCPFIYAAKRAFRLSDQPNLDLDVDASSRGRLMHALFERLGAEPFRADWSAEEIDAAIEEARVASATELADERLWPSLRARHRDFARRFLAHEREWRRRFPETKTVGREVKVAGFVDPESGWLSPLPSAGAVAFRGFIDRVDFDRRGFAAVVDYKSSAASASSFGSWLTKNSLQLPFYAQALERGLTELPPRPVANAAYFVAREMTRDAGFKLQDVDQGLYDLSDKKRNKATREQIADLQSETAARAKSTSEGVRAGRFQPNPKDRKLCDDCKWSQTCRAPHLNA